MVAAIGLLSIVALSAGVAVHILYFQRYEYHRRLGVILALFAASTIAIPAALSGLLGFSVTAAIFTTPLLLISFLVGGIGSTLFYRLYLNPLNRFPGPFAARLTDFWIASKAAKKLNQSQILFDLHREYGPVVRTGANHISIIDPDFVDATYGPTTVALKGPWYDLNFPHSAILEDRNRVVHDRRRRLWTPAFSDKALRAYETQVSMFVSKFLERIGEFHGSPVNVSKWFNLYAFDVMGTLALGKNYGMLDSGEKHEVLGLLTDGMAPMGLQLPPWFLRAAKSIPRDTLGVKKFYKFASDQLTEAVRHMQGNEKAVAGSTITSWLYQIYQHEQNPERNMQFQLDARVLIIAGSDTTAATLTYLFFLLAQNPEDVRKIREELRACTNKEDWSHKDIQHCDHLNGAIWESLRLYPPGSIGVYRSTPPEGMQVGDVYIPGNATFNIPFPMVARNESVYANASSFIPERWYSKPELVKKPKCFVPFLLGSTGCIGKNLALMEIRLVTAKLLLEYDVSFAPGEDGHRLLHESKDHFTMSLAPLDLVFTTASR